MATVTVKFLTKKGSVQEGCVLTMDKDEAEALIKTKTVELVAPEKAPVKTKTSKGE